MMQMRQFYKPEWRNEFHMNMDPEKLPFHL